jgi:replicative DNA helicase
LNIERDTGKNYDEERLYLFQLLTNTDLLRSCRDILRPELASNKYTEHLLRWLLEYYDVTGVAPGKDTTSLFVKHKDNLDEDVANNVQKILENLSGNEANYAINNVPHNAKNIEKYFNWRALSELEKSLKEANKGKDVEYALQLLQKFKRVEKTECGVYDPFTDHKQTAESFNLEEDRLIKFPGALGNVIGWFLRGDLIGFMAHQKAGKTWLSIFLSSFVIDSGFKVLYFNLEVTEKQFQRRIWQNLNAMPKEAGIKVKLPHFTDDGDIEWDETITKDEDLIVDEESIKKRAESLKLQKRGRIKVVTMKRGSATLSKIQSKTAQLEKELGFVPDLIVIDNFDVVQIKDAEEEEKLWMHAAGWAQEENYCILTPTQGNRDSYKKKGGIKALGGSYRKCSHVGKMFMLTMSEDEKMNCFCRVKLLEGIDRDDGPAEGGEAVVLHALGLGMWHVDSRYINETQIGKQEMLSWGSKDD